MSRPGGLTRLARYGITGLSTNAAVYVVFLGLIALAVPPIAASVLCYGLGLTLSYLINRRWTFASGQGHRADLPRFLAAYGVGLGVTVASMYLLLKVTGPALAQLVTIFVAAAAIYAALHLFRFGGHGAGAPGNSL